MMRVKLGLVTATLLLMTPQVNANLVFSLADTDDFQLTHTSSSTGSPPESGSLDVGNGTFSWGNLQTDTTANSAGVSSGEFTSEDWGGEGTFTSNAISLAGVQSFDIEAVFGGNFNSSSEFSNFFYQLDGGARIDFGVGGEAFYSGEAVSLLGLTPGTASDLVVGFNFNHNGSSDFFDVNSFTVTTTAIPEPTTWALVLIGGIGGGAQLWRRRQRLVKAAA